MSNLGHHDAARSIYDAVNVQRINGWNEKISIGHDAVGVNRFFFVLRSLKTKIFSRRVAAKNLSTKKGAKRNDVSIVEK